MPTDDVKPLESSNDPHHQSGSVLKKVISDETLRSRLRSRSLALAPPPPPPPPEYVPPNPPTRISGAAHSSEKIRDLSKPVL